MSRNRAAWLLLLAVLPVWAVGLARSLDIRGTQVKPRGSYGWLKRYTALRPHLEGVPKAMIVHDPFRRRRQGNKRLFRAQYVLAPVIVGSPQRSLPPPRPRAVPLIYDCHDQRTLDRVLKITANKARRRGVAMRTERVARGLAVVWMTER